MEHKFIYEEVERSTGLFDVYVEGRHIGQIAECWPNDRQRWRIAGTDRRYTSLQAAAKSLIQQVTP